MALLDFPSVPAPTIGQIYTFDAGLPTELKFIFKTGAVGASDGYWANILPSAFTPASSAEINAGTDAVKYVTPLALQSTKYVSTEDLASAAEIDTGVDNLKYTSPAQILLSKILQGNKTSSMDVGSYLRGNTPLVDADLVTKLYADGTFNKSSQNGYLKLGNGIILQWGSTSTVNGSTLIGFPIAFPASCKTFIPSANVAGSINVTHQGLNSTSVTIQTWEVNGSPTTVNKSVFWFAVGS